MKIIVDTNVLISAILKDRQPEEVILYIAGQPDIHWIVSREILDEYKDVLSRKKFNLTKDIIDKWIKILDQLTVIVDVKNTINFSRDQKDSKFLSCALGVSAEYLITGDKDFDDAKKLIDTTILSVSQFKKYIMMN